MKISVVTFFISLFYLQSAHAQNSVVVIPLEGETEFVEIDTFDRTVIVGGSGSDVDNGAALLAAAGAAASASEGDPWLIQVEPGVFDIGSAELELAPYVSLRGAGIDVTTIVSSSSVSSHDAVRLLGHNTLSDITVQDSSTASSSGAVTAEGNNISILDIKVLTEDEDGIRLETLSNSITVDRVSVEAEDRALSAQSSNSGIIVRNSILKSGGDHALNIGSGSMMQVRHSELVTQSTTKAVINILAANLEVLHSDIRSSTTRSVDSPTTGAVLLIAHSHVDTGAAYSFSGASDDCFAITTPLNFFTTSCQ